MKYVEVPVNKDSKIKIDEEGIITIMTQENSDRLVPSDNSYEKALGTMIANFMIHYSQLPSKE